MTTAPYYGATTEQTDKARESEERIRRAVKAARKRKGTWQAMARAISRNRKLKVNLHGSASFTDGKAIWIKVPPELGDVLKHVQPCGERDEDGVLICAACASQEDIDITIIHEVAHIVCGSFVKMSPNEIAKTIRLAIQGNAASNPNSNRAQKLAQRVEDAARRDKALVNIANAVSPWMGELLNAVEDIRINNVMMSERPGTRVMFKAEIAKVFREGTISLDGKEHHWRDQPRNAQAIMAAYLKLLDIPIEGKLADEVVADMEDIEFNEILADLKSAHSISTLFAKTFPLLECYRRLGYLLDDDDPEDEPEDGPGNEQESSPESEAGDGADASPGESGESDDSGESGSSVPGGGASPGSDNSDDNGGDGGSSDAEDNDDEPSGGSSSVDEQDETDSESDSADAGGSDEGATSPDAPLESPDTGEQDGDGESPADADDGETGESGDQSSDMGSPEEVSKIIRVAVMHGSEGDPADQPLMESDEATTGIVSPPNKNAKPPKGSIADTGALDRALRQADVFDTPSKEIEGLNVVKRGEDFGAWEEKSYDRLRHKYDDDMKCEERLLSQALMVMRRVFSDNARGRTEGDLRVGKVNPRVLGKRAPIGDDRLFMKKTKPKRKDYFVIVGLDVSGSTSWPLESSYTTPRLTLIKQAAYAKAELLSRLGVRFAVYAHSGSDWCDVFEIKSAEEPWGPKQKQCLVDLIPYGANLDGHTLEFYYKLAAKDSATNKIIMYYTDGDMPWANKEEELEILQDYIKRCKQSGIDLVGVGVETDSPKDHGLDTIQLDAIEDIIKVVRGLRDRITA